MADWPGNHGIEPVADRRTADATSHTTTDVAAAAVPTVDAALAKPFMIMDATTASDPPASTDCCEYAPPKQPPLSSAAAVRHWLAEYTRLIGARPVHLSRPHRHSKPVIPENSSLPPWIKGFVALPVELQIMIFGFLGFGGIEQLRRTCKFLRQYISKALIRAVFQGRLDDEIRLTCIHCLKPGRWATEIVVADDEHDAVGFTSRCLTCLQSQKALEVGVRYKLSSGNYSYICRLCGYPVLFVDGVAGERHFHHHCNERYMRHVDSFFYVRLFLPMIHICGLALCWAFYKSQPITLGCTTGAFFMCIWGLLISQFRSNAKIIENPTRTWHWSLIVELGTLALWLVILYDIRYPLLGTQPRRRGASAEATLGFVILIILIRTLNAIGLTLLTLEVKYWRRINITGGHSTSRRYYAKFVTFFFVWTSSHAVFQKYPPVWAKIPPLWKEQQPQPQLQAPPPAHVTGTPGEMV
jgi:hypothetical protein